MTVRGSVHPLRGRNRVGVDMTLENVDCGETEHVTMRMICWNVSGWSSTDGTNGDNQWRIRIHGQNSQGWPTRY